MDISEVFDTSRTLVNATSLEKKRYLYDKIAWDLPMICIKGARGIGKTTIMLQRIKENYKNNKAVYVSLDNLYFSENRLMDLVSYHYKHGGTHIFIDEVHRYPYNNWVQELKNIYDSFPDYHIVFTGSSLLKIDMSVADLSRRCIFYNMHGMSFREYLSFENIAEFDSVTLEDIFNNATELCNNINKKIKPLQYFSEYLQNGYYPFYHKYEPMYKQALQQIINTIIETDLQITEKIETVTVNKFKRLLVILSKMIPFTPNITKLGQSIEATRKQTYMMLNTLDKAALIRNLYSGKEELNQLNKPEKIYFENTNFLFALTTNAEIGNVRETFFANQLSEGHQLSFSGNGDFLIDNKYTIEVGGKNKSFEQIKDLPDSYLAIDDTEYNSFNKIPLWLFGFLY
ncbi:MAG: ATP-binding protein [Bacteroidales bacterium]|nr:ATP-binding protein [Bacteroidales bacterium]